MSCGNNYGWGGCGCANTVQFAPPACNPNFPTTCSALGNGNIVRVVGEDFNSCKYTIPPLQSNSLLSYNPATALTSWADASASYPIFLGSNYGATYVAGTFVVGLTYSISTLGTTNFTACGASSNTVGVIFQATNAGSGTGTAVQTSTNQVPSTSVGAIQGTTPTGQLVAFKPNTSTENQFPIVAPSSSNTTWGTIENLIPNAGVVYRPGTSSGPTGVVAEALGTTGQVLTWQSGGYPAFSAVSPSAFIDAQSISLIASSTTAISVTFGNIVFNSFTSGSSPVQNSLGSTQGPFSLNIYGTAGVGGLDTSTAAAGNTYYYVYAIYNTINNLVNVVASTSSTSPSASLINNGTGTNNYSYYRLIGLFYTNSSTTAGISGSYSQQGRVVYFGVTSQPVVLASYTTVNTVFLSGAITNLPSYQVANKTQLVCTFNAANAGTTNNIATVYITSLQVTSTSTVNKWPTVGSDIYGTGVSSGYAYGITPNPTLFSVFDSFIPRGTSYYCINLGYGIPSGGSIALSISGCSLSIF